tara:strand:+ start:10473 stop:10922 length:450 start_codon:yes stop_codon:yes gene_type:complete
MNIHLATDHAGLDIKNDIKKYLSNGGHKVIDHGAYEYDPLDDYPDFIFPCANSVSLDPQSKGIILGGSGQGEAMAANRIKGIRAAVYYGGEIEIVKLSRRHNDSNILSIGARFLSKEKIFSLLETWLKEPYSGGRHQNRLKKLDNFDVN